MEYETLLNGMKMPVLGLGAWSIGGKREPDYSEDDSSITVLKKAIDLGYTLIDTAEVYGGGHCEELVGKAIKGYDRGKLFIVSKVASKNLHYDDIITAADNSLQRLGIEYFDLYLIHAPNPDIPIEESMKAMNHLVDTGKTKSIGVSNFDLTTLKAAQSCSKHPIVANQIEYNLISRNKGYFTNCKNMEKEIIPYCQEQGIVVMAYRPIERGKLTKPGYPVLDSLAKKYDKTRAQIAINWLINKKGIMTIPKSSKESRLKENFGAFGWKLSPEDMTLLDKTPFSK